MENAEHDTDRADADTPAAPPRMPLVQLVSDENAAMCDPVTGVCVVPDLEPADESTEQT